MTLQDACNPTILYSLTVYELGRLLNLSVARTRSELRRRGLAEEKERIDRVPPQAVRKLLEFRRAPYRFQVIAVINLRGGVGKTTCTVTAASRAAQYGFRCCVLDLDAQGSASLAFDRTPAHDEPIFYDVWQKPQEMLAGSLKAVDGSGFLYLLPSSLENGLLDVSLINPASQKNAVRNVCSELERLGFDLVVIDCPPSLGAVVISSICAADLLVVPLWSDPFSFKGVELTIQEVQSICETFGLKQPSIRLLYSRHDRREKLAATALEKLRSDFQAYFAEDVIPTSTEFSRVAQQQQTIFATSGLTPAKAAYDGFVRSLLKLDPSDRRKTERL